MPQQMFVKRYACWYRELLQEIGFTINANSLTLNTDELNSKIVHTHPKNVPLMLQEDNQACIAISKNPEKHSRTKHIEVKYHFIRDLVEAKLIKFQYCPTSHQTADLLTKPLPVSSFEKHRLNLGLDVCPE